MTKFEEKSIITYTRSPTMVRTSSFERGSTCALFHIVVSAVEQKGKL